VGKAHCSKRLFGSQETPEEAATITEDQAATLRSMISPNTLRGVTIQAIEAGGTPQCLKKKKRKRPAQKKKTSALIRLKRIYNF
jgi:hypothetical protein